MAACSGCAWLLAAALVQSAAQPTDQPTNRPTDQPTNSLVLSTPAGDVAVSFFPDVAPRHTAQMLKLARSGALRWGYFNRVEPGFVAQYGGVEHRDPRHPLTDEQRKAVARIPAEFGEVKHTRGVLSMAHPDNDPDGAETSFSVLLGDAPHLDGKYTVFGRVERGMDVFDRMEETVRRVKPLLPSAEGRPAFFNLPLFPVTNVRVLPANELPSAEIAPARTPPLPPEIEDALGRAGSTPPEVLQGVVFVAAGVLLMMAAAYVNVAYAGRLPQRTLNAVNMFSLLVGAFLLFTIVTPHSHGNPWVGLALLAGMVALFRFLGRFESPA